MLFSEQQQAAAVGLKPLVLTHGLPPAPQGSTCQPSASLVCIYSRACLWGWKDEGGRASRAVWGCAHPASVLPNSWKQRIGGEKQTNKQKSTVCFAESFTHIVQTCDSAVKIHQLSGSVKPGAELHHLQTAPATKEQPTQPFPARLGAFRFPSWGILEPAWMPGGAPPELELRGSRGLGLGGSPRGPERGTRAGGARWGGHHAVGGRAAPGSAPLLLAGRADPSS